MPESSRRQVDIANAVGFHPRAASSFQSIKEHEQ